MAFEKLMKSDGTFNPSAASKCTVVQIRYDSPGSTIITLEYDKNRKTNVGKSLFSYFINWFHNNHDEI